MRLSPLGLLVPFLVAASPLAGAAAASRVELFSPQGTVKQVRQVTARFSDPMVPFGDPRLVEPFGVACPEAGSGRWADTRHWVYDFARELPGGVACSFRLKPGLTTLDGRPLAGAGTAEFSFSTGGPGVLQTLPAEGSAIDEEQIFVLGLDAPAVAQTVEARVHVEADGIAERVGVSVLLGEERREVLEVFPQFAQHFLAPGLRSEEGAEAADPARATAGGTERERFLALRDGEDSPLVVLRPRRRLPSGAGVRLVWGQGVTSRSGIATEQDQTLAFRVREPFRVRFSCERVNPQAACIPVLPMRLTFSAPVARSEAERAVLRPQRGALLRPVLEEEGEFVQSLRFDGPFPEHARFALELPSPLRDDAGRALENQSSFPLSVGTDEDPPLAKFPADFGIVELVGEPVLPVTLRNLEASLPLPPEAAEVPEGEEGWGARLWRLLGREPAARLGGTLLRVTDPGDALPWLGRVHEARNAWQSRYDPEQDRRVFDRRPGDRSVFAGEGVPPGLPLESFEVPRQAGARAFQVVGIPLPRPGLYVVELASRRLGAALFGEPRPYFVQTAVLVTNLSVHFLRGRESSLVWVTTLDRARPVAGARVAVRDGSGRVYFEGVTDAQGLARIGRELPEPHRLPPGPAPLHRGYVVTAQAGPDWSFVLSTWNEGISPWRFDLPWAGGASPDLYTAVLDRTLFRAGETMRAKLFARRHTAEGIIPAERDRLPPALVIAHEGSDQKFELPLTWRENGTAETAWPIPPEAKQGTYRLSVRPAGRPEVEAGTFRVESFRVPTMRAVVKPVRDRLVRAAEAQVDVQLTYLSGGAASGAAVKLRGMVEPRAVSFPGYDGFAFAAGDVRAGPEGEEAHPWRNGGHEWEEPEDDGPGPLGIVATQDLVLDPAGGARATLGGLPEADIPQTLLAELEYQDANGEWLSAGARVPLWPSEVVLGLKPDGWAVSRDRLRFQVAAVDPEGEPVPGAPVEVDLFRRVTYSHRKRLVGGFYAYEHRTELEPVGELCRGATDAQGLLACEARSPVDGNVILRARSADRAGNPSYARHDVWVARSGQWWFDVADEDRMDVIAERKRYEPGETARFQVRMPFREATALVTVEREGVMETFLRTLTGDAPVVEVPVRANYAPNVFVSVLAVRGRVAGVQPTALVDLGKPAFKLGIGEIQVGWRAHELAVQVEADRPVYRVRETARVAVAVRTASGAALPPDAEVVLVAVDEALLELAPNRSWALLDAMMGRRGIEVETATAQLQVVGRRHRGRKAVPHGGGGGRAPGREWFDPLLLWRGAVPLDEHGEAQVDIPLNDSLTSFRIVAVASAGSSLFGTGATSIRTTQDLMLLSGLPPLVREGDSFRAAFTVRNAAERPMQVRVVAGLAAPGVPETALSPADLALEPGEAREVGWEVEAPVGAAALHWEVAAAEAGSGGDRFRVTQAVLPAVPVRVFQATLLQLEAQAVLASAIPEGAVPGRGGVRVELRPSLAGGLSGVREYMERYPYTCLEQRVSQAVALRDRARWEAVAATLPSHLDRSGLAKYFPSVAEGSDVLTAYVLALAHEAGYALPEDLRQNMTGGLLGFAQGKIVRGSALPTADLSLRKLAALEAVARYEQVDPAILASIAIEPELWPTSGVLDWLNLLSRTPGIRDAAARRAQAEQVLRARLDFQATTLGFSTERSDYLWWLMVSADTNAGRAILSLLDAPAWRDDLPRLVRGALGRQREGRWSTTPANAWGVLALEKFAQRFEAEPVGGVTASRLGASRQSLEWGAAPEGGSLDHPWASGPADLTLTHEGTGRPWGTVHSRAAIPLREPLSSGYRIERTVTPVAQARPGAWSRGDVARVRLEVEAQSDMTWVVVRDPIPAGAGILGTGLGGDSPLLTRGERRQGWVWPAFEERTLDSFRAYYAFVPQGRWAVEYTVRFHNPGLFSLPPTRVEALYAPEMFGEVPNAPVRVEP